MPIANRVSFAKFKPLQGVLIISLAMLILIGDKRTRTPTRNVSGPPQLLLANEDSYSTNHVNGMPVFFGAGLLVGVFGLGAGVL